jgi:hypothetical protein
MRAWLRDHADPVFQRIVRRFDPSIEMDQHLAFARIIEERWPAPAESDGDRAGAHDCLRTATGVLLRSTSGDADARGSVSELIRHWRFLDIGLDAATPTSVTARDAQLRKCGFTLAQRDVWGSEPGLAIRACAFVLRELCSDAGNQDDVLRVAAGALSALPPREWFIHKRGTFYGTAWLLRILIDANARIIDLDGDLQSDGEPRQIRSGTLDVLDRLVRHIEVRRDACLRFAAPTLRLDEDHLLERTRYSITLLEAAGLFHDLRYLNTAMKLIDQTLSDLRRQPPKRDSKAMRRCLAYVVALTAQEDLIGKAFSP